MARNAAGDTACNMEPYHYRRDACSRYISRTGASPSLTGKLIRSLTFVTHVVKETNIATLAGTELRPPQN